MCAVHGHASGKKRRKWRTGEPEEGGRKVSEVVYMIVSKPPYYLPELVADSVVELAQMAGVEADSIYSIMSRNKKKGRDGRYVRVVIDKED